LAYDYQNELRIALREPFRHRRRPLTREIRRTLFGAKPPRRHPEKQNSQLLPQAWPGVDASVFPSSGAVNPALTVIANTLRVGDHLLGRVN
jgi:hypothetical protein